MGWSEGEVRAVVDAYFEMLRLETAGRPYVKAEFRREVLRTCSGRTAAAVELKFQNVSAILAGNNLARIEGYKPKGHYQGLLAQQVLTHITRASPLPREEALEPPPAPPSLANWQEFVVPRPPPMPRPTRRTFLPPSHAVRIDHAAREARNSLLGRFGEEFVLELEQRRLESVNREDLAGIVKHASKVEGDGLGFDIRSFNDAGDPRLVEVKTTRMGPHTPFFMSNGEMDLALTCQTEYRLARVFHWGLRPQVFFLGANEVERLQRETQQFRCWI